MGRLTQRDRHFGNYDQTTYDDKEKSTYTYGIAETTSSMDGYSDDNDKDAKTGVSYWEEESRQPTFETEKSERGTRSRWSRFCSSLHSRWGYHKSYSALTETSDQQ